MDIEHDVQKPNNDNEFKCDICEQLFVDKSTLVNHIKKQHDKSKPCKYFAKGLCMFSTEICWYSHDKDIINQTKNYNEIICKFCEEKFHMKSELMNHRKSKHTDRISFCRNNENKKCEYGKNCWYKHTNEMDTKCNDSNSDINVLTILKLLETRITSMENQYRIDIQ